MKPISTGTEQALREALTRLVSGNATRTDGLLTVANLAREAGVGRATANRAPAILAELCKAAEAARRPRLEKPRAPLIDADQDRRELENVIAQHLQVRALLQRARDNTRSRLARIRLVGDGG